VPSLGHGLPNLKRAQRDKLTGSLSDILWLLKVAIRYDLLNLMVKLNWLSVCLAEEKVQILVKLDVQYASFCL
jgi:hypothetical protein